MVQDLGYQNIIKDLIIIKKKRTEVLPGIIGLAQVNGRNDIDIFEKINYDIEYVDNLSFKLDLKILLKSFKSIIIKEDINKIEEYLNEELKKLENQQVNI